MVHFGERFRDLGVAEVHARRKVSSRGRRRRRCCRRRRCTPGGRCCWWCGAGGRVAPARAFTARPRRPGHQRTAASQPTGDRGEGPASAYHWAAQAAYAWGSLIATGASQALCQASGHAWRPFSRQMSRCCAAVSCVGRSCAALTAFNGTVLPSRAALLCCPRGRRRSARPGSGGKTSGPFLWSSDSP